MRWSVVMPVYNEEAFLTRSLGSLARQAVPFRLILVDNGSTDRSREVARGLIRAAGMNAVMLDEPRPGQVHALVRGIAAAETELVAICDADTWYPASYLAEAGRLFDREGGRCVATGAWQRPEREGRVRHLLRMAHQVGIAHLLPRQNHTGGGAHCFRTAALKAVGGYDPARWPYVLKDHELMNRVLGLGRQAWSAKLWCVSSERRGDRRRVRWTLAERIAYHVVPFEWKHRFFHQFLGPRFSARGQADTCLRERSWGAAA